MNNTRHHSRCNVAMVTQSRDKGKTEQETAFLAYSRYLFECRI